MAGSGSIHVARAQPAPTLVRPLVRRMLVRAQPLPPQARVMRSRRDDGWLLSGLEQGAVVRIAGPYIVSGGWWAGAEPRARTASTTSPSCAAATVCGSTTIVNRRRWFWQGTVE